MNNTNPRQQWLDILKGIGIVAVVVGHIAANPLLVKTIFLFHMPLFFLVGGWLHDPAADATEYLRRRALGLLLPYACYLIVLWPLELLVDYPGQAWTPAWMGEMLLKPMLLGGPLLKGFASVFWFVTCYFLTQQLVHMLLRHFSAAAVAACCASMLGIAWLHAALAPQWWLPWNVHTLLFTVPLYCIGHAARRIELARWLPAFAVLSLLAVLALVGGLPNTLDLKNLGYGLPVVTLACALAWCGLLACAAYRLQFGLAGQVLGALGAASLTIMFVHQAIQLSMAKLLHIDARTPRIAVALLAGYLLHLVFQRQSVTRKLLLGSFPRSARIGQGAAA